MLKVFLVEDESIIRESLRDNFPWQNYGFQFAGEAGDGEMALPLIRKLKPDVLITDIKMPFMDGLALSHIVGQELPNTKIIIISGYDDFEYARQAIREGVDQYLLKPITRNTLRQALSEVREKIEQEQEQKNYLQKYENERHEYEQFYLRNFYEKVFAGKLSVQEIYEEAQKNDLDTSQASYNLIAFYIQEKAGSSQSCQRCQEELMRYLMRFPNIYQVIRWNVNVYIVLVRGGEELVRERTALCVEQMTGIVSAEKTAKEELDWYIAAGEPVERFSQLTECYHRLNHIFSYRFFAPAQHVLTEALVAELRPENEEGVLNQVSTAQVNPEILKGFLQNGQKGEIREFVRNYLDSLKEALKSRLFRDYLILNTRFATLAFVESIGISQEKFLQELGPEKIQNLETGSDAIEKYMEELLQRALEFRDQESGRQGKKVLKEALEYIAEHFTQENLSLNTTAAAIQVSPNYFSAMFSQEMQMTFVEYVTEKRIEYAKKLLRETNMRSSEVALAAGYKNPQYFSFVFKKTQGCTPREYSSGTTLS